MTIGPETNHRERETGVLVYPVYSRRSGGLSLGINLFPGAKLCSFDCPYCEVFPFKTDACFSLDALETGLKSALSQIREQNIPLKDLCFSGNGEPSISPHFPQALAAVSRIRNQAAPSAGIVLITNGSGLLDKGVFSLLSRAAAGPEDLKIWLKLDAGAQDWYKKMSRSSLPFSLLLEKIKNFAARVPVTIQTMLCAIDGLPPPPQEAQAWEALILELAASGPLSGVQIYGKARPAPQDPLAQALPPAFLQARAASLIAALDAAGLKNRASPLPVEVFP
jgi:histidinol dehydrogenase